MTRAYWIVAILITLATLAVTGFVYPGLSERIPTHWNLQGQIDGYGPRWTVFLLPATTVLMLALFRVLPWLSPKGFGVESFQRTYLFAITTVLALFAYLQCAILYATTHEKADVTRILMGGIFLFFIVLGNVMGKVRRNFYLGIRTPWTLASERVWVDTHRLGAWTMVGGGLIGLVLTVVGNWLVPAFIVLMIGVFIPVIYSLVHYKHLERTGQL